MKRSPDSVIEIDIKLVDGKVSFHRFFCAFGPCIEGFRSACRPWLVLTPLHSMAGGMAI
jgi:hypothetical protein